MISSVCLYVAGSAGSESIPQFIMNSMFECRTVIELHAI